MSDDVYSRPPIASQPISVVLISRGEPGVVSEALSKWNEVLNGLEKEHELIVVQYDTSNELMDNSAHEDVCRLTTEKGFGAALAMGISKAQHPLLCYCTADDQYQPGELTRLLEKIDETDIVTGYRVSRPPPMWFRLLEWTYRAILQLLFGIHRDPLPCWLGRDGFLRRRLAYWAFGLPLYDPECAFRLCRREILARVPIQSDGAFAHLEVAAKANFLSAIFEEVAVSYQLPQEPQNATGLEKPAWPDFRRFFSNPKFGPVEVETWGYTCLSPKMLSKEETAAEESDLAATVNDENSELSVAPELAENTMPNAKHDKNEPE